VNLTLPEEVERSINDEIERLEKEGINPEDTLKQMLKDIKEDFRDRHENKDIVFHI
jgi:hypothetical protein